MIIAEALLGDGATAIRFTADSSFMGLCCKKAALRPNGAPAGPVVVGAGVDARVRLPALLLMLAAAVKPGPVIAAEPATYG